MRPNFYVPVPAPAYLILFGAAVAGWLLYAEHGPSRKDIDKRLARLVDHFDTFNSYRRSVPLHRLVDVYLAIEALAKSDPKAVRIASAHEEPLALILSGSFWNRKNAEIRPPESISREIGPDQTRFFPADGFVVLRVEGNERAFVVRLKADVYKNMIGLEIGSDDREAAESLLDRILSLASERSIYRGHSLEITFEDEIRDEYGDVEQGTFVDLRFLPRYAIAPEEIILEDDLRTTVQHTLLDFHARRETLQGLGLPSRRGVLLYGPPGTGKTHLCKYLAHELEGVTTIVATGRAQLHARSICQTARMLQPALVVLEDVDLVYSQREGNAYGVALGELMDELDGFARQDAILFALTTNAIDRVEAAVKDRPGRISQCIHMGLPGPSLRRRFLEALLGPYDTSSLDLDAVVALTDRSSQAFLKELVFRSIQTASLRSPEATTPAVLSVSLDDIRDTLHTMKEGAGREGAAILGFHLS